MTTATNSFLLRAPCWLFAWLAVSSCGQTGPLYLPGNPSQVQVPVDVPEEAIAPVSDDDAEDTDDNDEQGY